MKWISFTVVALGLMGCAGQKVKLGRDNVVTLTDVLTLWAAVVKDKRSRYDAQMHFRNEHAKGIIFGLEDVHCFRGNTEGQLHRILSKNISLDVAQERSFNFICDNVPPSGEFRFVVAKVYENPNGDGVTRGAVMAKNLEWKN